MYNLRLPWPSFSRNESGILNGDLVVSLRHFRFRSTSQRYSRKRSRCFWPVSLMFKFLLAVQAMQTEVHDEKQLAILKDR